MNKKYIKSMLHLNDINTSKMCPCCRKRRIKGSFSLARLHMNNVAEQGKTIKIIAGSLKLTVLPKRKYNSESHRLR